MINGTLLSAATRLLDISVDDLQIIGEGGSNVECCFIVRKGFPSAKNLFKKVCDFYQSIS